MDDFLYDFISMWGGVNPFSLFAAFVFGSTFGSFLNVCVYRLPLDRSVVFPPSACTSCGTPIKLWNNIPIFSYFLLGGRCATCASPYSFRYALIEFLMGVATAGLLAVSGGFGWTFVYRYALLFLSVAVFLTDLDHWIIPDQLNFTGVVLGVLGSYFVAPRHDLELLGMSLGPHWANVVSSLVGAVFGAGFFWVIQVFGLLMVRQEAMGGGDVKYAAAIGAFLGWQLSFLAFLLSFFLGAAVALPLMLRSRGRGKEPIPFGTFMAVAAVPTAIWGTKLLTQFYAWSDLLSDRAF